MQIEEITLEILSEFTGKPVQYFYNCEDDIIGIQYENEEDQCNECLPRFVNVKDIEGK